MTSRRRLDDPAPGFPAETRRQRHVRLLTDARDRLRAALTAHGIVDTAPSDPVPCRLHGAPGVLEGVRTALAG